MNIITKANNLIKKFQSFKDWQEKYEYIIFLGKNLISLSVNDKKKIFNTRMSISSLD